MTVAVAPRAALPLFREARSLLLRAGTLPGPAARDAVQGVIAALEALGSPGEASKHLDRWARELLDGHSTTAAVHLDRAVLALGLRPSDVRRAPEEDDTLVSLDRTPPPAPRPAVEPGPAPRPAVEPGPATERVGEDADAIDEAALALLSPEERELVAKLPLETEPLQGAGALAECWGGRMSPTSARGRYSRLANKLKEQHGRDLLLRGRGRYARLKG